VKICIVGPTYPFRGGISHYTTLLYRNLRKKHDTQFYAFKRQYPQWLFPGESDKDMSNNPIREDGVENILDSLNPITWLKVFARIKRQNPQLVIFPWWVSFWTPQFWTITSLIKIFTQSRIVFICHNVIEHEPGYLKKIATKTVLSKADCLITHSQEDTQKIKELLGDNVNTITAFHPTYADLNIESYSKHQAKEKLGLSENVLLFFGFVREYKGLHILLEAIPLVLKKKDITLLVVGEFWRDKNKYLDKIRHLNLSKNVRIVDKYIPNEEIGIYFTASDLVVQPYISASGSGISQLAYGFNRPVIATNVGSLPEVIDDGVNGRVVAPNDVKGLANAIIDSLNPDTLKLFLENASKTKEKFSWEKMVEIISRQ
jgi:glycosyltransferase involved in cell wall biosynthesis